MKVVFHEDFCQVYTGDPAAAAGRMEAVVETIEPHAEFVSAAPAVRQHIAAVHTVMHIEHIENLGLYKIAAQAAGSVRRLSAMEGGVLPYSREDTTTKCSGKMCWP